MGAEVQTRGFLPENCSMGNPDQNSNGGNSSQKYNGLRSFQDTDIRGVLRQTIVEHDAIFRNQVSELHRLLRVQTDLVNEIRRDKLHTNSTRTEGSSSLGHLSTQRFSVGGKSTEISLFQSQSGGSSNNFEVHNSRPHKVRKNMFDLHLPADEFINSEHGEQIKEKIVPVSFPDRNYGNARQSSVTLSLGSSEKAGIQIDGSGSVSASRITNLVNLSDQSVQRTNTFPFTGLQGPSSCRRDNLVYDTSMGQKSQIQQLFMKPAVNSHNEEMMLSNIYPRGANSDRGWFSHMLEAGCSRNNSNADYQGPENLQMSTKPMQHMLSRGQGIISSSADGSTNMDLLRNRTFSGLEFSERCLTISDANHQILRPLFGHSSNTEVPVPGTVNNSPIQKLTNVQRHPSFNSSASVSTSFQPQTQNHRYFTSDGHADRTNHRIGSGSPHQDGLSHISSSGFEPAANTSSVSSVNLRCINFSATSEHLDNLGSGSSFKDLHFMSFGKCLNLNAVPPSSSSTEQFSTKGQEKIGLKMKNDCLTERKILGAFILENPNLQNETTFLSSPAPSQSLSPEHEVPVITRKNRVIDINMPCDQVPQLDKQASLDVQAVENTKDTRTCCLRDLIDLNSCAVGDDDSSVPLATTTTERKITVEINLEAPAVPDCKDDKEFQRDESAEQQHEASPKSPDHNPNPLLDRLADVAAEIILSISSVDRQSCLDEMSQNSAEASMAANLHCLANVASCYGDNIASSPRGKNSESNGDSSEERSDYFESKTLQLTEMTEEEYMPRPAVPENIEMDESNTPPIPTRPRRGPARRGRQRRDFQRDILPGLSSLSRQEVNEDLQAFGGMMQATGHSWNSGSARRNSARNGNPRGKRQLTFDPPDVGTSKPSAKPEEQLSNAEMGQEDRSPTPWGKTPKRPRRQRVPVNVHVHCLPV